LNVLSGDGWFLEKVVIKSEAYSSAEVMVFRCHGWGEASTNSTVSLCYVCCILYFVEEINTFKPMHNVEYGSWCLSFV